MRDCHARAKRFARNNTIQSLRGTERSEVTKQSHTIEEAREPSSKLHTKSQNQDCHGHIRQRHGLAMTPFSRCEEGEARRSNRLYGFLPLTFGESIERGIPTRSNIDNPSRSSTQKTLKTFYSFGG